MTYKTPRDRIPATADLTFQFSLTCQNIGTGRMAKRKSVKTASAAVRDKFLASCHTRVCVYSTSRRVPINMYVDHLQEPKKAAKRMCVGGMHSPTAVLSQFKFSGRHASRIMTGYFDSKGLVLAASSAVIVEIEVKGGLRVLAVAQRTVKTVMAMMIFLYILVEASRCRKSPALTFVKHRAMRHIGCVTKL